MNRKQRGVLCLMIEVTIVIVAINLHRTLLTSLETTAAFAEGGGMFSVEIATDDPKSSEASNMPVEAVSATPFKTEVPTPAPTEDNTLRVEVLRTTDQPPAIKKRILIYHTHTWEAYQQVASAPYRETEKWRTKDDACNVIAVGRALTASLTALGFTVVHDETAFEPPNLDDAYDRSLAMLNARTEMGEHYDLYIDLHRDAIASSSNIRRTVSIAGEDVARFMVLVGKGTTGGYAQAPDWEANYAIAERITRSLNDQCVGLARDIKVKTGRFNQHIAPCCVLLECGVNSNTLEEVLRGVPYLAQAIADALADET